MKPIAFCAVSLATMLAVMPLCATAAERAPYRLAPGDILQIGVFGVADFGRRVTVNVDGDISVPFLGEVEAEGLTIRDLRQSLGDRLIKDGRIEAADVTVELLEYRPFYIAGDVSRPGAVPYRPGLTVRHAVALAGGFDALRFRAENPLMTAPDLKNENEELWIDLVRQEARAISLSAELSDQDTFDLSPAYSAPLSRKTIDELADFERRDFSMRRSAFVTQRAFLESSLRRVDDELSTLAESRKHNAQALILQQAAVDRMEGSATKGLVMVSRVDDERQTLAELRGQQVDIQSRLVMAQRAHAELTRNIELQKEQHRAQLNERLREATIEKEKLSSRLRASGEKLLYTGAIKAQLRDDNSGLSVVLHRKVDGALTGIQADEDTEILPDDVVEVTLRPEQMMLAPDSN
jgi:polysaccharide export outer membrane protein